MMVLGMNGTGLIVLQRWKVLASNKSGLVIGICCALVLGLYSVPAAAVASKAEENQSKQVETETVKLKDKAETEKKKTGTKSKAANSRQNNRTHFGMGYEQRSRFRGSSMGGSRKQSKGRGR